MNTEIETLDAPKKEWDALQPLAPENDRRLWQKLRLEWNYHSNHIEGNTLTYGETELLLIHGQTHGNHNIREYAEMQAHDLGIVHLRELAEDQTRLIGETDIRNLNRIILKEPFWKAAETSDGQATRKQIIPGEYKETPNNVRTATGEIFEFAAPTDVPAKMQELVQWLEQALSNENANILTIIAKLHHDFVLIHPFDDGNGRVARMLVNYVLMRQGYPPIIVPTERKKDYLTALRLADAGDISELENFIGSCVTRSLELGIKAAKGESLDEPGDVEKEIELFKRSQEHHKDKVKPKSAEAIQWLYENGLSDFITKLIEKIRIFDDLFVSTSIIHEPKKSAAKDDVQAGFQELVSTGFKQRNQFVIRFGFRGYRGEAKSPFNVDTSVEINFTDFEYSISLQGSQMLKKLYSSPLFSDETADLIERVQHQIFSNIRKSSGKA